MQAVSLVPLCLEHGEPMKASAEPDGGYSCDKAGCNRHFTLNDGYFTLIDGRRRFSFVRRCRACLANLYLAKRGKTTMMEDVWLCADKTCPSKQR